MKKLLMMALCMGQIATMKAPYVEDKERDTTAPRDDTREKPSLFRRLGDFLTGKKPTQKAPAKITAQQAPSKSQVSGDEAQAPVEAPVVDAAEESRLRELEPPIKSFEEEREEEKPEETDAERDARVEEEVKQITEKLDDINERLDELVGVISFDAKTVTEDNWNLDTLKGREKNELQAKKLTLMSKLNVIAPRPAEEAKSELDNFHAGMTR